MTLARVAAASTRVDGSDQKLRVTSRFAPSPDSHRPARSSQKIAHRHWNVGFYIFFMIFSLIYLAVRVWVSLIVTKLYSLLMKIGEHRAKEVDDHHSYDAKCACMP